MPVKSFFSIFSVLILSFYSNTPIKLVNHTLTNYTQRVRGKTIYLKVKDSSFPEYSNVFKTVPPCEVRNSIRKIAYKLYEESETQEEYVENVVEYVSKKIKYKDVENEMSAEETLKKGFSDCRGKANLSYELLCAFGIRVKKITGYLVKYKKGILQKHRWLEVYFPKSGWYLIDPSSDELLPIYVYTNGNISLDEIEVKIEKQTEIGNLIE